MGLNFEQKIINSCVISLNRDEIRLPLPTKIQAGKKDIIESQFYMLLFAIKIENPEKGHFVKFIFKYFKQNPYKFKRYHILRIDFKLFPCFMYYIYSRGCLKLLATKMNKDLNCYLRWE